MNHKKPYNGFNGEKSKRRYDSGSHHGPPAKKHRPEINHFQKTYTPSADITLPNPVPELPSIASEYEEMVFTHPGTVHKGEMSRTTVNYDRLEFLGDAYIEIVASQMIFENYPTTGAGGMCKLRESVVKNETLSKYSLMYGFDKKLNIKDDIKDGSKGWTKIYGDVFEAYAAAVVLSDSVNGQKRLEKWLKELWAPVLREVKVDPEPQDLTAKGELSKKIVCPGIRLSYVEERKHVIHMGKGRETFFIGVYMDGWGWKNQHLGSGEGASKASAGNEAALSAMNNHPLIDEIMARKEAFLAERASSDVNKDS